VSYIVLTFYRRILAKIHLECAKLRHFRKTSVLEVNAPRHRSQPSVRSRNTNIAAARSNNFQFQICNYRSDIRDIQGGPKNHIFICLMLNWYSFVKSLPNFIIFGWEDILNIACKLISTVLCDWHYLVVCQHNSWANFMLRQHRKRTILFLQSSVGTRNRCCGQYMHCFVGNLYSGVSLPKIIKLGWDFTKLCNLTSSKWKCAVF